LLGSLITKGGIRTEPRLQAINGKGKGCSKRTAGGRAQKKNNAALPNRGSWTYKRGKKAKLSRRGGREGLRASGK